jgi:hypothetical protein
MKIPPGAYTRETLPPVGPGALKILQELNIEGVSKHWPDKRRIACTLASNAEVLRRTQRWLPIGETALYTLLASFGAKIGLADNMEQCAEAYKELLLHLEHPEPRWD